MDSASILEDGTSITTNQSFHFCIICVTLQQTVNRSALTDGRGLCASGPLLSH